MITLACFSVLYTAQPYRQSSDNSVAVLGQALVYCWLFLLLLRVVSVGGDRATVAGCSLLVAVTIGLFAFALHAIYSDLRKVDMKAKNMPPTATSEPVSENESPGAEAAHSELQRERNLPREVGKETELSMVPVEDGHLPISNSPWELLGLCAADPEMTRDSPEDAHGSDEVTVLLARLDAQSKLVRDLRKSSFEKDEMIREKDKEIARFEAGGQ